MSIEDRRVAALRQYHEQRPVATRSKLTEALDRMKAEKTVVLKKGAKWTKTNLCLEAGVNIHTLLSKDANTGKRRYEDVLKTFDKLIETKRRPPSDRDDDKDAKIAELRAAYNTVVEEKEMMALQIDELGMELLKVKEEVERLLSLEEQNADLREEIRNMQASPSLRLVGKAKGKKK